MKKKILFFTFAICLVLFTGVLFGCSNKCSSHEFTSANCVWNNDGTAEVTLVCGVCGEKISETADMKEEIIAEPTCEKDGLKRLTAIVGIGGNTFNTFVEDKVIPAVGHEYSSPTYSWNSNNSLCTAKKTCIHCNDVIAETATASVYRRVESTCSSEGSVTYAASFKTNGFDRQMKATPIKKKNHDFIGEITYTWTENKCTASRKCANCSTTEKETAVGVLTVTVEKTCTTDGVGEYSATFKNTDFVSQTKTIVVPKGHVYNYDNPTYTWSDDHSACDAKIECSFCDSFITEHGKISRSEKAETCTEDGFVKFAAKFDNAKPTTFEQTLPSKGGHSFGEVNYVWTSGNASCSAERLCSACGHKDSEKAIVNRTTVKAASCTEDGESKITASFKTSAYATQTKTETIAAKGHHGGNVTVEWNADNTQCVGKEICSACKTVMEEKSATTVKREITVPKTCTSDGKTVITATITFTDGTVYSATTDEAIPASHEYGEVVYEYVWQGNSLVCTASKICLGCGNVISETKTGAFSYIKEENGKIFIKFIVKFDNSEFGEKIYEFEVMKG